MITEDDLTIIRLEGKITLGEAILIKKYIRKLRHASEYRVTTMPDKEAFPKSKHPARPDLALSPNLLMNCGLANPAVTAHRSKAAMRPSESPGFPLKACRRR